MSEEPTAAGGRPPGTDATGSETTQAEPTRAHAMLGGVTRAGSVDAPPGREARMWRRGLRRRRSGEGEQLTVPEPDFRSYYGVPVVKTPPWEHDVPAYLFTGGLAAGSSLLAAGADLAGAGTLRRVGRVTALGGLLASTYFLINDLGRPERFYMMLRVARPTSPMSMGTWILAAYGLPAGVAATAEAASLLPARGRLGLLRRLAPPLGRGSGLLAAAVAPALASYTGVLLSDTAMPSWHEAYRELPFVFAGSALASGAGVGLIAAPLAEQGPARRMAVVGAALEMVAELKVSRGHGLLSEPYETGKAGRLLRLSQVLTVAGAAGALLGGRRGGNRLVSALSGLALLGGSLATRFGVFEAGVASAKDPKYTVVPQRERLARGEPAGPSGNGRVSLGGADARAGAT